VRRWRGGRAGRGKERCEAESASEGDAAVLARQRTGDASAPVQTRRLLREVLGSANTQAPCWGAGVQPDTSHRLPLPWQPRLPYPVWWDTAFILAAPDGGETAPFCVSLFLLRSRGDRELSMWVCVCVCVHDSYTMTCGAKFGSDFLAYPGAPPPESRRPKLHRFSRIVGGARNYPYPSGAGAPEDRTLQPYTRLLPNIRQPTQYRGSADSSRSYDSSRETLARK